MKALLILGILLLIVPVVSAQFAPALDDALNNGFGAFFDMLSGEYTQFGLTIIFMIILFTNIFNAALMRVKVFGGSGGTNKYGKMVSTMFALLSTLGLMFFGPRSPLEMMRTVLSLGGWLAALAIAILAFGLTYYNFKDGKKTWAISLMASGIGLMVYGSLMDSPSWNAFGMLFVIIGFLLFLFGGNAAGKGGEGGGFFKNLFNRGDKGDSGKGDGGKGDGDGKDDGDTPGGPSPEQVSGVKGHVETDPQGKASTLALKWNKAVRTEVGYYEVKWWRIRSLRLALPHKEMVLESQWTDPGIPSIKLQIGTAAKYWVKVRAVGKNGKTGKWSEKVTVKRDTPGMITGLKGRLYPEASP